MINHNIGGMPYDRPVVCTKCAQENEHHRFLLVPSVFLKGDQPSNPSFSAKKGAVRLFFFAGKGISPSAAGA